MKRLLLCGLALSAAACSRPAAETKATPATPAVVSDAPSGT